ncbi:MAG TPA: pyruvate:ferredoxin (flavodoxin) oxidoreductase [Bacilli bacterium]|nr:pyruvate:ferredoxin (flavodoxin) oxidoreductase [Bacilli bacterium]
MNKKYKVIDGNTACAEVSYLFTEAAGIYPITPSSDMAELIDEWSFNNKKNFYGSSVKVVQMQSEAGAIGFIHGLLQAGTIASTYTSSQGLLLMIPNMYKIAGELLPCVINVSSRAIATHALSIMGDHQDIYAVRQTGFAILASSSVQDIYNLSIVANLSTMSGRVPIVNFFDGFRLSHEYKKIEIIDESKIKDILDFSKINEFKSNSILSKKVIRGTAQNDDIYFQNTEARNTIYNDFPDTINNYMKKINELTGKEYKPFNYYGSKDADSVIIAMGAVCDTIKEVIDNEKNSKIGLVEVHLYRPFSKKYLFNVLPRTVKKIAVLDRTKEHGSIGEPLYLDILGAFSDAIKKPLIIGGRYGLAGKNTDSACIKGVYDHLNSKNPFNNFTIGIEDYVTNLSIKVPEYIIKKDNMKEIIIYGYGSDGMVSASKNILSVLGNNTEGYVQGYFEYDSRKSGNVTKCHLRISKDEIRSEYYLNNKDVVICTKYNYLSKYNILDNINENGIFILVTDLSEKEINDTIDEKIKKIIKNKHIKFYIIDAYSIAEKHNLKNKISTVVESIFFYLTDIIKYDVIVKKIQDEIVKMYSSKGKEVVEANLKILLDSPKEIKEIELVEDDIIDDVEKELYKDNVFNKVTALEGNKLTVKDFLEHNDGSYETGTTKYEKRALAEKVSIWNKDKCIECNFCSFVCPHAVIRPFILTSEEVKKYNLEDKVRECIGKPDYYFYIGISSADCTGCSLCANICPAQALTMIDTKESKVNKDIYKLFEKENEELFDKYTIKGSQFKKPLFEFSGACAGCGETPYIKLLTQLFGEKLVIANATGCSSIYGASSVSMPYSISWMNSLFEDNAEFGYGLRASYNMIRHYIENIIKNNIESQSENNKKLLKQWLDNKDDFTITSKIKDNIDYKEIKELETLKEYIPSKSIWIIGGDGWAYDIGYGGLDHVLAQGEDVNILVLDTECYSNTGGQASKSTKTGAIAKFAIGGKSNPNKDLARLAISYDNVYVASISLGANMMQALTALKEAEEHQGPSIVIAYSPCINHGIKGGMSSSINEEKLVVESGYFNLFRYKPSEDKLYLDYKNPNFDLYDKLLNNESRYNLLKTTNEEFAKELLEKNKKIAIDRFNYYKELSEK